MTGRKLTPSRDDTRPPQNPTIGRLWFDQALGCMRRWDGKQWAEHKPGSMRNE